jgi:hypothetical protein
VKNGEIVVSSENPRSRRGIGWKSGSPSIKIHLLAPGRTAINNLAKVRPGFGINRIKRALLHRNLGIIVIAKISKHTLPEPMVSSKQ